MGQSLAMLIILDHGGDHQGKQTSIDRGISPVGGGGGFVPISNSIYLSKSSFLCRLFFFAFPGLFYDNYTIQNEYLIILIADSILLTS